MLLRWSLAALHLVALAVGFAAIWTRARALTQLDGPATYRRVFLADSAWGIAAVLWIGTGLLRAFGPYEKGSGYYLANHLFWAKMAMLVAVLLLELWPMLTLVRWRVALGRGRTVDASVAPRLARVSFAQAALVVGMVLAATGMARGLGRAG